MPYLTKRRYLPSCVVGALAKVAILFHDSTAKLPTMQQKIAKQYPGWLHVTCCRLWPKFPSGEYENRGRSETKGQVDIYGSKLSLFYRKFDRKLAAWCRKLAREGVLGTTRHGLQGYSLYRLYDVLLNSMDEGVYWEEELVNGPLLKNSECKWWARREEGTVWYTSQEWQQDTKHYFTGYENPTGWLMNRRSPQIAP